MLASRFGILWRPLRVPLVKAPVVIETCMCLHNILIDRGVQMEVRPPLSSRSRGYAQRRPHINNNGGPDALLSGDGAVNSLDTNDMIVLRDVLTTEMAKLGMKRPAVEIERARMVGCL